MENWSKKTAFVLLLSFLTLTACTKAPDSSVNVEEPAAPNETQEHPLTKEEEIAKNKPQPPSESHPKAPINKESTTLIRQLEKNIELTVNGVKKQQTAFLNRSDTQNFSMYVLPDYELLPEESTKDIVVYKENKKIFMRIELLPEGADWRTIVNEAKTQLSAIHHTLSKIDPPAQGWLASADIYQTATDTSTVSVYLLPADQHVMKLTLFDDQAQSHQEAFLKMAETIK